MLFMQEEGSICLFDNENILVFPLLIEEIELLKNDKNYFENYLNLKYEADYEFGENSYMTKQLEKFKNSNSDLPWRSIWAICSAKHKAIIGTINFKNQPDDKGNVEIYFSINPNYQGQNFATTAVKLISNWSFENGATSISALVQKDSIASKKVLLKNNFNVENLNDDFINFKKEKPNNEKVD